jgi:hypothetical protein
MKESESDSESEVLKTEESESEVLCTDSTALDLRKLFLQCQHKE